MKIYCLVQAKLNILGSLILRPVAVRKIKTNAVAFEIPTTDQQVDLNPSNIVVIFVKFLRKL